jgi:hypothetical protein
MKQVCDEFKVVKSVRMTERKVALTNRNEEGIRGTVVSYASGWQKASTNCCSSKKRTQNLIIDFYQSP